MEPLALFSLTSWILAMLLAVTLHEAAHGWVAERFGDNTARSLGRVTFNPLKHIDLFGTVILPVLLLSLHSPTLFGYAKPIPVDFHNLRPYKMGILLVAIAGPVVNLLLALASSLCLHLVGDIGFSSWIKINLLNSLMINCALVIFNMFPILPLDGGRVLRALLPNVIGDQYAKSERYGIWIILTLLIVLPSLGIRFFTEILILVNNTLIIAVLFITGHGPSIFP